MLTNFKRVFHFALIDFYRNKGMSIAAIFVLTITILLASGLFFLQGINEYLISSIQNKIDITAYFKSDTAEQDILDVKESLLQESQDIKNIEYVSKDQALADFNVKHQDNPVFANALDEVGENPFLPSLNITTNGSTAEYEAISTILQRDNFSSLIEKVDFSQKKDTIEKIFTITKNITMFGLILAMVFALVVILVVFNTIKLVIDSSKEEIATMQIVGASSWFVRMPYIIEGGIFGVIAVFLSFWIVAVVSYFLSPAIGVVLPGFNLFAYLLSHMLWIVLIQFFTGVALGVAASFIVVRSYLKV